MSTYARGTSVSPEKSRLEIEQLLHVLARSFTGSSPYVAAVWYIEHYTWLRTRRSGRVVDPLPPRLIIARAEQLLKAGQPVTLLALHPELES